MEQSEKISTPLSKKKSSEAHIEASKRWNREHPEACREADKRWREKHLEAHRERVKRWNKEHPEAHREGVKRWDRKHPEAHRERIKRWRRKHPEAAARIGREYYHRIQDEAGCHSDIRLFFRGYLIKKALQDCKEIVEI